MANVFDKAAKLIAYIQSMHSDRHSSAMNTTAALQYIDILDASTQPNERERAAIIAITKQNFEVWGSAIIALYEGPRR